jgi:hypothetical protein
VSESPAAMIRRTAALMRERAAEMPPFPWRAEGRDVTVTQDYDGDFDPDWDCAFNVAVCRRQDEAEYVASWHPLIVLAIADLLEEIARQYDLPPCDSPDGVCNGCERREDFNDAVRLARAYLGEAAP